MAKIALATDQNKEDGKKEKIKSVVTRKLYGKQKPNIDLRDGADNAPLPTWAMACRNIFMLIVAIFVFVLEFFVGGFQHASMKALETINPKGARKAKLLDVAFDKLANGK